MEKSIRANAEAKVSVLVVLATPPLWLHIAITVVIACLYVIDSLSGVINITCATRFLYLINTCSYEFLSDGM